MTARTIIVEDVGPAGNLVIPVQPGGTVIKGYCGVGKSITLEAIHLGLGGREKGRVAPRTGTKRGRVDILGVMLSVSAGRVTKSGESEVIAIEEFDIGALIDPPVKDEDARNRHGIKSLLRMTGATADPALFYHLIGDKAAFEKIVPPSSVKTDDLVDLAGKIKRALEAEKRRLLEAADKEEASAAANRNAGDGLDMTIETDGAKLQQLLVDAAGLKSTLDEQAKNAKKTLEDAEMGRLSLATIHGSGSGTMTTAEAQEKLALAEKTFGEACDKALRATGEVSRLEIELRAAKDAARDAVMLKVSAEEAVKNAKQAIEQIEKNKALCAAWQAAIDAAADVYSPSEEDLAIAADGVQRARKMIEQAAVVLAARERIRKAEAFQKEAARLRKEADRLRDAALDTDSVLSAAVASRRYAVRGAILMAELRPGVVKPYYDMSDGERTLIAVDEKIDRVAMIEPDDSKLRIIDLPQRTFQDLPDSVRRRLFATAAQRNTCIVTGQVTDDKELWAEVVDVDFSAVPEMIAN